MIDSKIISNTSIGRNKIIFGKGSKFLCQIYGKEGEVAILVGKKIKTLLLCGERLGNQV